MQKYIYSISMSPTPTGGDGQEILGRVCGVNGNMQSMNHIHQGDGKHFLARVPGGCIIMSSRVHVYVDLYAQVASMVSI